MVETLRLAPAAKNSHARKNADLFQNIICLGDGNCFGGIVFWLKQLRKKVEKEQAGYLTSFDDNQSELVLQVNDDGDGALLLPLGNSETSKTYAELILDFVEGSCRIKESKDDGTGELYVHLWKYFLEKHEWFHGIALHKLGEAFYDCLKEKGAGFAPYVSMMIEEGPVLEEVLPYLLCHFLSPQLRAAAEVLGISFLTVMDIRAGRRAARDVISSELLESEMEKSLTTLDIPAHFQGIFKGQLEGKQNRVSSMASSLWRKTDPRHPCIIPLTHFTLYLHLWELLTFKWKENYWEELVKFFSKV